MKDRFFQLLIWVLSLSSIAASVWVVTHLSALPTPQPFVGRLDNLILLFSSPQLGVVPGLFRIAIWTYAVAVVLACGLALLVIVGAGKVRVALMMSGALSGLAFFVAQFMFVHRIIPLRGSILMMVGDYVGMFAGAFGIWAAMRVALTYPEPIDVEAYVAVCRKASLPSREWERWLYRRSGLQRANELAISGTTFVDSFRHWMFRNLQKVHAPVGMAIFGSIFVALWQGWGLRPWMCAAVMCGLFSRRSL